MATPANPRPPVGIEYGKFVLLCVVCICASVLRWADAIDAGDWRTAVFGSVMYAVGNGINLRKGQTTTPMFYRRTDDGGPVR